MNSKLTHPLIVAFAILAVSVTLVSCICIGVVIFANTSASSALHNAPQVLAALEQQIFPGDYPSEVSQPASPTRVPSPITPSFPQTVLVRPSPAEIAAVEALLGSEIPVSDLVMLAERLQGRSGIPRTLPWVGERKLGDQDLFWAMNVDTKQSFQLKASLQKVSDHAYIWIEDGVAVNQRTMDKLAEVFDRKIYPTNQAFFGSEWKPGIDSDLRLHILYARGLGDSIAGYYASMDEYVNLVNEYSNAREIFFLNADTVNLDSNYTFGVLAHEHQHMVQWLLDRNEETWMNEGLSNLAAFLNDYDVGSSDQKFAQNTDIQLTDWPTQPDTAHYGAAFLYLVYLLDRFGEEVIQAIVRSPANGLESVDQVLKEYGAVDSISGAPINADDLFSDWTVANYLGDQRVGDGRYAYRNYLAPIASATEVVNRCPSELTNQQVHQYGADYIRIRCKGGITLSFKGSNTVDLLPTDPHSGNYVFWSNHGEESDMTLTRAFDFSNHNGPLSLAYWTWYDLEEYFDHLYVLASVDNGDTWQILTPPSATDYDPSGNSFGRSYTGRSSPDLLGTPGWILEHIDISNLAGKQALIRFEYVTDAAVNGAGFILDDLAIPEIGYHTDFEDHDESWVTAGFIRVQNTMPQVFHLAVIEKGRSTQVKHYSFSSDNTLELPLQIGGDVKEVILVISGTTRITRQQADYQLELR